MQRPCGQTSTARIHENDPLGQGASLCGEALLHTSTLGQIEAIGEMDIFMEEVDASKGLCFAGSSVPDTVPARLIALVVFEILVHGDSSQLEPCPSAAKTLSQEKSECAIGYHRSSEWEVTYFQLNRFAHSIRFQNRDGPQLIATMGQALASCLKLDGSKQGCIQLCPSLPGNRCPNQVTQSGLHRCHSIVWALYHSLQGQLLDSSARDLQMSCRLEESTFLLLGTLTGKVWGWLLGAMVAEDKPQKLLFDIGQPVVALCTVRKGTGHPGDDVLVIVGQQGRVVGITTRQPNEKAEDPAQSQNICRMQDSTCTSPLAEITHPIIDNLQKANFESSCRGLEIFEWCVEAPVQHAQIVDRQLIFLARNQMYSAQMFAPHVGKGPLEVQLVQHFEPRRLSEHADIVAAHVSPCSQAATLSSGGLLTVMDPITLQEPAMQIVSEQALHSEMQKIVNSIAQTSLESQKLQASISYVDKALTDLSSTIPAMIDTNTDGNLGLKCAVRPNIDLCSFEPHKHVPSLVGINVTISNEGNYDLLGIYHIIVMWNYDSDSVEGPNTEVELGFKVEELQSGAVWTKTMVIKAYWTGRAHIQVLLATPASNDGKCDEWIDLTIVNNPAT